MAGSIDYKNNIILASNNKDGVEPKCKVYTIATDISHSSLAEELATHRQVFDKSLPTVWILEGLIYYHPPDKVMSHTSNLSSPGGIRSMTVYSMKRDSASSKKGSPSSLCQYHILVILPSNEHNTVI
jgi:O-methyltransferase involved in polyketide biosynthesis